MRIIIRTEHGSMNETEGSLERPSISFFLARMKEAKLSSTFDTESFIRTSRGTLYACPQGISKVERYF